MMPYRAFSFSTRGLIQRMTARTTARLSPPMTAAQLPPPMKAMQLLPPTTAAGLPLPHHQRRRGIGGDDEDPPPSLPPVPPPLPIVYRLRQPKPPQCHWYLQSVPFWGKPKENPDQHAAGSGNSNGNNRGTEGRELFEGVIVVGHQSLVPPSLNPNVSETHLFSSPHGRASTAGGWASMMTMTTVVD